MPGDTGRLQDPCLLVLDDALHLISTEDSFLLEEGLIFVIIRRQLLQVHKAFQCNLILSEDCHEKLFFLHYAPDWEGFLPVLVTALHGFNGEFHQSVDILDFLVYIGKFCL